ncbi:MAG TPA: peptidylprolyl isomerase [Allosphingosinicella sp.]|jgi:peptidylprolyl isomerase
MRLATVSALACALALASACTTSTAPRAAGAGEAAPSARYTFWRPAAVLEAKEPAEVIKSSTPADWRPIEPENLMIMELANGGQVAIELVGDFAPIHVANIKALARGGWWNPASVYRVQENYVVQWGLNESDKPFPASVVKLPPAEYDRGLAGLDVRPLGYPDSYAPMVGHAGGWPIGYDPENGRAWLAHCYGMVGVGRDLHPDTGSGGELYAVTGHAPRQLDKNIALVGRVVEGLERLTAHPRGTEALGFIKDPKDQIPIRRIVLAADMPAASRPAFEVMRTDTETFSAYVTGRANRAGTFFRVPAGGVDVCNVNVPVRRRAS